MSSTTRRLPAQVIPSPFRVAVRNPHPSYGDTDIRPIVGMWQEVARFFTGYQLPSHAAHPGEYILSFDIADFLEELRSAWLDPQDKEYSRRLSRLVEGDGSTWIGVRVQQKQSGEDAELPLWFVGRLFQELFLTMNLALPGSCNLYQTSYVGCPEPVWPPVDLGASIFEDAWHQAQSSGWPPLKQLSFAKTWDWLHNDTGLIYATDIGTTPVQKALYALLSVGNHNQTTDQDLVLLIAQTLESLLVDRAAGVAAVLRERVEALFGFPGERKKWVSQFYDLRSRIAHGAVPVIRPGGYCFDESNSEFVDIVRQYWAPLHRALALVLAILQDLVDTNSRGYEFSQVAHRIPG